MFAFKRLGGASSVPLTGVCGNGVAQSHLSLWQERAQAGRAATQPCTSTEHIGHLWDRAAGTQAQ